MAMKFSSKRPLTDKEEAEIQKRIADDPDNPEITDEQLREAKPFVEAFPELAEAIRKKLGGRPPLERPKKLVSLRLDADVLDKFRATGKGWQSRINEALRHVKI